jgi:hypothetical protein
VQHSGKRQVVDVKRLAGNFLAAFFAWKRFAYWMSGAAVGHDFLNRR